MSYGDLIPCLQPRYFLRRDISNKIELLAEISKDVNKKWQKCPLTATHMRQLSSELRIFIFSMWLTKGERTKLGLVVRPVTFYLV